MTSERRLEALIHHTRLGSTTTGSTQHTCTCLLKIHGWQYNIISIKTMTSNTKPHLSSLAWPPKRPQQTREYLSPHRVTSDFLRAENGILTFIPIFWNIGHATSIAVPPLECQLCQKLCIPNWSEVPYTLPHNCSCWDIHIGTLQIELCWSLWHWSLNPPLWEVIAALWQPYRNFQVGWAKSISLKYYISAWLQLISPSTSCMQNPILYKCIFCIKGSYTSCSQVSHIMLMHWCVDELLQVYL